MNVNVLLTILQLLLLFPSDAGLSRVIDARLTISMPFPQLRIGLHCVGSVTRQRCVVASNVHECEFIVDIFLRIVRLAYLNAILTFLAGAEDDE
jgi:hypothetical protein